MTHLIRSQRQSDSFPLHLKKPQETHERLRQVPQRSPDLETGKGGLVRAGELSPTGARALPRSHYRSMVRQELQGNGTAKPHGRTGDGSAPARADSANPLMAVGAVSVATVLFPRAAGKSGWGWVTTRWWWWWWWVY